MSLYPQNLSQSSDTIFSSWYDQAIAFAKGQIDLPTLVATTKKTLTQLSDLIMSSENLDNIKKFFVIFSTKPKFIDVIKAPESSGLIEFISTKLLNVLISNSDNYNVLSTLVPLVELERILIANNKNNPNLMIFKYDFKTFVKRSMNLSGNTSCYNLYKLIAESSVLHAHLLLKELASFAHDAESFSLFFRMNVFDPQNQEALAIIAKRAAQKINMKADTIDEMLSALANAIRQQEVNFNSVSSLGTLVKFIEMFDIRRSPMADEKIRRRIIDVEEIILSENEKDRCRTLLDITTAALYYHPNDPKLINFHLKHGFTESIDSLTELTPKLQKNVIIKSIYPFALDEFKNAISLLSVTSNITSAIDPDFLASLTDVILNILDKYYGSTLARATALDLAEEKEVGDVNLEFGHTSWICLMYALEFESGTRDTQRFPVLGASILLHHIPDSSKWLIDTYLSKDFQSNIRLRNFLDYILFLALDLPGIEDPLSAVAESADKRTYFLNSIIREITHASTPIFQNIISLLLRLLQRCGDTKPKYLLENKKSFLTALKNAGEHLNLYPQHVDKKALFKILDLTSIFSALSNAEDDWINVHFDLLMKVVSFLNQARQNKIFDSNDPEFASLLSSSDDQLSLVVESMVTLQPHQLSLITSSIGSLGSNVACSLAKMVPHLFLSDPRHEVLTCCLTALQYRPDLLVTHSDLIAPAIKRSTEILHSDVLLAAAPVFTLLSNLVSTPKDLLTVIEVIVIACSASAEKDIASNRPAPIYVKTLNDIITRADHVVLKQTLKLAPRSLVSKLEKYSSEYVQDEQKINSASDINSVSSDAEAKQEAQKLMHSSLKLFQADNPIGTLRIISQLKKRFPIQAQEINVQNFVEYQLFPAIASKIPSQPLPINFFMTINEYENFIAHMHETILLAPVEAKKILHVDDRINELTKFMVDQLIASKNFEGAKSFLFSHAIHNPALLNSVNDAAYLEGVRNAQLKQREENAIQYQTYSSAFYPQVQQSPFNTNFNYSNQPFTIPTSQHQQYENKTVYSAQNLSSGLPDLPSFTNPQQNTANPVNPADLTSGLPDLPSFTNPQQNTAKPVNPADISAHLPDLPSFTNPQQNTAKPVNPADLSTHLPDLPSFPTAPTQKPQPKMDQVNPNAVLYHG